MLVFPQLDDIARAFPYLDPALIGHDIAYPAMLTFLPDGRARPDGGGAARRRTSPRSRTHLNWGTSYLVHDLYRRFLRPDATEHHYVWIGRLVTALLMLLAAGFTFLLDIGAHERSSCCCRSARASGLLYLLRWYWWRINAWSEIAAMAVSFTVALGFFVAGRAGMVVPATTSLLTIVGATTVAWVGMTLLTKPESEATLMRFYRLVRPPALAGPPSRGSPASARRPTASPWQLAGWVLGCTVIYAALFGTGSALYGLTAQASMWGVVFVGSGYGLIARPARLDFFHVIGHPTVQILPRDSPRRH